jgi:predicted TIM-barrel fold metal-dependent hydrolase
VTALGSRPLVIDAHVRVGASRDVTFTAEQLLESMAREGIDRALIAPSEAQIAFANREGNDAMTALAARHPELLAYAVATPWQGARAAVDELARARDAGAVALCIDPALQGFDPFDGLMDPLVEFAAAEGWFVYVRTGTPPHSVPLVIASVARRYPETRFLMGRTGATDFWTDVTEALRYAPNLYGETVYNPWDLTLEVVRHAPGLGSHRFVFGSDSPYATQRFELERMRAWPIDDAERAAVLGGTIAGWLGLA